MGIGSCLPLVVGGTPVMRRLVVSLSLAISALVAAPAAHAAGCSGADAMPSTMSASAANHATLCLLNQQRRAHGLRSLRNDGKLGRAAAGHPRDMVTQHFFDHNSRNGATFASRIKRTGWTKSRRAYTI